MASATTSEGGRSRRAVIPHSVIPSAEGSEPCARRRLRGVFNIGQRAAVVGAFRLAGYEGPLLTAPVTSEDERAFLLEALALKELREVRTLEQVLQQLLGRKVFVVERDGRWGEPVPFD